MRHPISLLIGALVGAMTIVAGPTAPAQALTISMTVVSPVEGRIGVDVGVSPEYSIKTCSNTPGVPTLGWNSGGQLVGTTSLPDTSELVRIEMYPGACGTYDGWGNVGGVHFEANRGGNQGTIVMPVAGNAGAFALHGDIVSSTNVSTGRVKVDSFQIPTGYPDPPAPLQQNGQVAYGGFASTNSRGARWSGGIGWPGRYLLFVTDTATGRKITANVDIGPTTIPTIDLDAICFGFDTCNYLSGGPGGAAGSFHPLRPTRILDTRRSLGIADPVRSGDGRDPSPNPITRREETANHDLQVTGRYGVPATGVSAVLLNVTVINAGAPGPGFMSVVPKPARVGDVFNDQGSYGSLPTTSNLNIDNNDPVANLVLARVGAGGKIRLANHLGPTHTIADIAGWFDNDGLDGGGTGFAGVVPERLMDSRNGIGGPARKFAPKEIRSLQVAGVAGIPRDARSVVVNITLTGADRIGFVTAFPDGQSVPDASNVNIVPGGVRATTAVVKVGTGGRIKLFMGDANADVIVDVLGSYGAYGGSVTTISPVRIIDSRTGFGTAGRPWSEGEVRDVAVAGRGGVPADATAVVANVTATGTTAWGFLSVWPAGTPQPTASNLNFLAGQTVPNLVMLKLGTNGELSILNGRGAANVIVDVMGYVT